MCAYERGAREVCHLARQWCWGYKDVLVSFLARLELQPLTKFRSGRNQACSSSACPVLTTRSMPICFPVSPCSPTHSSRLISMHIVGELDAVDDGVLNRWRSFNVPDASSVSPKPREIFMAPFAGSLQT